MKNFDGFDFIRVMADDHLLINDVYNILKQCGENMFYNEGLEHWKNPYKIESIQRDVKEKYVYIVKSNDESVATIMISCNKSDFFDDDNSSIYISKVATRPKDEGKGIGTAMLSYAKAFAIENGKKAIRLEVYTKSVKAIDFYENKGFRILYEKPTRRFTVYCMELLI